MSEPKTQKSGSAGCARERRRRANNLPPPSPRQDSLLEVLRKVCTDENGEVSVLELIARLQRAGFNPCTDARLRPLADRFLKNTTGADDKYNLFNFKRTVPVETLADLPPMCDDIIRKTLFGGCLIPEFSRFSDDLLKMYEKVASITTGKIPEFLARPGNKFHHWGVSICTVDGQIWSHGDSKVPITVQACSAALNYAIAISRLGTKRVHQFVGKEATEDGCVDTLDLDRNGVPHNAMIQSGAIATTSLLLQDNPDDLPGCFEGVVEEYSRMAGGVPLKINNTVYLADKSRSDRKFSIAYLLKEHRGFPPNLCLKHIIDLYFQLNSIEITCETGAVIAGTLANGGICPATGVEVLSQHAVRNTLSIMHLQGMYSYSGEWMFQTGLPTKSAKSGIMLIVVPGIMGMCLYSPPLDAWGNSSRGVEFGKMMSKRYALHYLDNHISAPIAKENLMHRREGRESREVMIMNVMYAAAHGDVNLLNRYVELGLSLDVADYDHRTALHLACCSDNLEMACYLIDHKVDVCALDRWNRTPLDDAKEYASAELVNLLRDHGANEGPGLINVEV